MDGGFRKEVILIVGGEDDLCGGSSGLGRCSSIQALGVSRIPVTMRAQGKSTKAVLQDVLYVPELQLSPLLEIAIRVTPVASTYTHILDHHLNIITLPHTDGLRPSSTHHPYMLVITLRYHSRPPLCHVARAAEYKFGFKKKKKG
jgi:hypothetical protein